MVWSIWEDVFACQGIIKLFYKVFSSTLCFENAGDGIVVPRLLQVLHPLLGERRPDDIAGQVLHGRIVVR